jgi:hypothetical protein
MSGLAYWLYILVWPIGVVLVVIAIEVEARISAARARRASDHPRATGTT